MKQVNGFRMWIFNGSESKQPTFRGAPVVAEGLYVGHSKGGEILAGPFDSERRANLEIEAITNTSGT